MSHETALAPDQYDDTLTVADMIADAAAARLNELTTEAATYADQLHDMGVVETELEEVPVHGPHRLLVLDETVQPSNAFKYNGLAYAVLRAAEDPATGTIYIPSAGNAGLATTIAAGRQNLDIVVYMPSDGSPVKEQANLAAGATVDKSSADVAEAVVAARQAALDNHGTFIHPFNDEHGVAGQGLVAERLVNGLYDKQDQGELDLTEDPVEILVQRGGGSLLGGIAAAVMREKTARRMGDNVQVREVRPERQEDGSLNRVFDGLAVEQPGELTAPLIQNERYVRDTVAVTEQMAGRAAVRLAMARDVQYEPSGLVGAAAFEQLAPTNHGRPTTYVTVLSGANVSQDRYDYLADQADTSLAASTFASGPSYQYSRGPVQPGHEATPQPTEAQRAYRQQLETMGIHLAA